MVADLGVIIAIVGSSIAIIATMISMFFWVRSEANNDRRRLDDVQKEDRKDLLQINRNIENEMKDFHYRLLEIERNRSK